MVPGKRDIEEALAKARACAALLQAISDREAKPWYSVSDEIEPLDEWLARTRKDVQGEVSMVLP